MNDFYFYFKSRLELVNLVAFFVAVLCVLTTNVSSCYTFWFVFGGKIKKSAKKCDFRRELVLKFNSTPHANLGKFLEKFLEKKLDHVVVLFFGPLVKVP